MLKEIFYALIEDCLVAAEFYSVPNGNAQTVLLAPTIIAATPSLVAGSSGNGELEKITVTGYIVPRVDDGPAPVTTLDQDYIAKQGDQSVFEVLQRISQNVSSFTPFVFPGGSFTPGAFAVILRGLPNSTLLLIDGHRQAPYPYNINGIDQFVDLNSIPIAAVDRIEVLTDGASATYGSDAIAGVVNVILKDDYNGADLKTNFGISQRNDFETIHTSLVARISKQLNDTSKFSIFTAFDYFNQSPVYAIDRSYLLIQDHDKYGAYFGVSGPSSPAGAYRLPNGTLMSLIPGTVGPVDISDFIQNKGSTNIYNTGYYNELYPRETRYGGYVKLGYKPTQWLKLYEEFSDVRLEEKLSSKPSRVSSLDDVKIPVDNPYNPYHEPLKFYQQSLLETGLFLQTSSVSTIRTLTGMRLLNLPKNWFVDATFLYAESDGELIFPTNLLKSRFQEAINGTLPGFVGQYYNPFVDQSVIENPNRKLAKAFYVTGFNKASTRLTEWVIRAGGEIVDLPGGTATLGPGLEYRSDAYEHFLSNNQEYGLNLDGTVDTLGGGKDYVRSAYGELTIPILGDHWSWLGARALQMILAEHYDEFSSFGNAAKPKISLLYKPFNDLTFRASYAEGYRAPFVTELYAGENIGYIGIIDPSNGKNYSVQARSLGNPNLKPEVSYSYYVGTIWTPRKDDPEHSPLGWANGFSVYLNWTEITKTDEIGSLPAQNIVDNKATFPQSVVRDPQSKKIIYINDPYLNLAATRVDSLDFGANYTTRDLNWGRLSLGIDGTYYYHYTQKNLPNTPVKNLIDSFTLPDIKVMASIYYSNILFGIDTFQTRFTLNFTHSEHDAADNYQGTLPTSVNEPNGLVYRIGSYTTIDWQISHELGKS